MAAEKTLILIPTYNESGNVRVIFERIKELKLGTDILFVDDHSPDGTGALIDEIIRDNPNVYVLHRAGKMGIGSAHQDGIRWAYEKRYTTLITMDCDFSHSPDYLRDFLKDPGDTDIIVGSRYMDPDSLKQWNLHRKALTRIGHFLTKTILKMPYDATGAFRLYRLNRIPAGIFDLVQSKGYSFFFESLYILHLNKCSIREFSIRLPARTYGHSKMTLPGAFKSFLHLVDISLKTLTRKELFLYAEPFVPDPGKFSAAAEPYVRNGHLTPAQVQSEWEHYWNQDGKSTHAVYDLIAAFYRVHIIRGILEHFIRKHFAAGASVLHAGCGSGQVDAGVAQHVKITAMDISVGALNIYKKCNPGVKDIAHGDIMHTPFGDQSFDGIYNLGVMEHFTEEEIKPILKEFNRILKPGGKMVILVPPEFGLSVRFLKVVHFILNKILRRNIQLHPAEISRPRSEEHAQEIYEQHGLTMVDYYFGIKDVFTYAVIVLQKNPERAAVAASVQQGKAIIVTGATGFIGRRLVDELVKYYDRNEIVCLVRPQTQADSHKEKSGREKLRRLGLSICEGDLLTGQGLQGLPRSPRLVFHLASITDTAAQDHSINDVGTKNLFEAIGPLNKDAHVIFTSSIAVNDGPRSGSKPPLTESSPTPKRPYHIYGRKKLRAEHYLTSQSQLMGFGLSIIRVCGVFGVDSIESGLYRSLKELMLEESSLVRLNWPGRISSMYVEDIAYFIAQVSRHKPAGQDPALYMPCTEAPTVAQMCQAYHEAYGIAYEPIRLPRFVWKIFEVISGEKRVWEKILPGVLFNRVWQLNILVGQAYWNESQTMDKILTLRRLTTFKEFCHQLSQQDKERSLHEILRRDHVVHPS
jgi:dolichol-phosphate mannosyltransferase